MKLIKRIKTLGMAAVMASSMLLSSFTGITASATMSDTYYNARTNSNKVTLATAAADSSNPYILKQDDKIAASYQYMLKTTNDSQVSVVVNGNSNMNATGQTKITGGRYNGTSDAKLVWALTDNLKGKIVATYSHCGFYKGKEIAVKMTVQDWEFLDNNQSRNDTATTADDANCAYITFPGKNLRNDGTNRIGVSTVYCSWVKVKYDFVVQGTNTPVDIKGYTTFNDIDGCQGIHFIQNYGKIYPNSNGTLLHYYPVNGTPYIFDGSLCADASENDSEYWITSTFSGTSMTIAFTFGMNNKMDSGVGNGKIRGGAGWIIHYDKKVVRSALEPEKTVSDSDETDVEFNTLSDRSETFTYKISNYIAYEDTRPYSLFTILDYVPKDLDVLSVKITDESGKDLSGSWEINKTKQAVEAPTTVVANNHNASNASFYDKTYNLLITVRLRDDVEISSGYTITNTANVTGTGTPTYSNSVKTKVNVKGPSISKYINTIGTESYSLHKNSEDITYVGDFYCGNTKQYSSVEIRDTLPEGLKYKSFVIIDPSNGSFYTSYGTLNSGGSSNFRFTFNKSDLPKIFNKTLRYFLTVTADKKYNGNATKNEVMPNTASLIVDGKTVNSNTPKLYCSGVNSPEKDVDKYEVSEKTEDVTFTISNEVESKTKEYYYNSYAITDTLDEVLRYDSARVVNESGTDVTSLFNISNSGNTITATARNTATQGFYGHTYKLKIQSHIKKNADLSSYCNDEGIAVIPNTSTLIVDGNSYPSNTVDFRYNPIAQNSADKYLISLSGAKAETTQLNGKTVTYSGSASIQNKEAVTSVVLSDKLDNSLRYNDILLTLNGDDITDWGNAYYDEGSNTISFTFNDDRLSSLAGETIEYTLTCEYVGKYSDEDVEILNTVNLTVNNDTVDSNTPKLYISGVNTPIKSVDKSEISEKTETVTYTISNEVDSKTQEYFYNSYVISDTLEDVLEYKSAKVLNEDGTDVSNLFNISENNNTVTATAQDTSATSFYGHTYKLEIKASLIQNADLSGYYENGKATIPNTSKLTVNGHNYTSNTVNFSYQPKSNSADKYILNSRGEQSEKAELIGNTVTYTGSAVIQDNKKVQSVALSDKLNSSLKYKSISVSLDGKDISDWGTVSNDEASNTVRFTFNLSKVAALAGKTIKYTLICDFSGEISDKSVEIPNILTLTVNSDSVSSNEAILTTKVDPSITKYINESDEGYSLHKKSEDITYSGKIIAGTRLKSKLSIKDNLASGLTYKSLKIFDESGKDITSYGTNASSGSTVTFVFNEDKLSEIYNTILSYELIVTASKNYNGSATKNEETPNTILLLVEDETVQSNTPKLYRSGVNSPVKSIDKSEISEKTETVTYTISNEVDSKTQEYFYNTFVILDKLADVLEYKSAKIVNENGADASNLFTITEKNNTVTATAKDTSDAGFYGHTYKLVIEAAIIDRNTDISKYCDENGMATIPNSSTLTVDGNAFTSNTVNFTYQTKSNSVDKYIINRDGEKSTEAQLYDNVVTYTGKAVVKDSNSVTSIVLSDKLDSNLKYKAMNISLDGSDISDWGTSNYDEAINTISFAFNKDKLSSVAGKTVEYALTCDYTGDYSNESKDISNIIDFAVNKETAKSNDTDLKVPVDSYITKYIYNGNELVNEYTLPTDRKDNTINYGGSILISEKEEVNNFEFTDKLDSNLEFESINFFNGNKEIKSKAECNNGVVKLTISDDLTELQGKVIQWKMTCRYVGDENPTQKITISNTANIIVNDESYDSNKVNVYIPTVMEKKSVQKDNVSNSGNTSKDITSDNQTSDNNSSNDKLTSAINSSQQNSGSTQPYTGSNGNKAPMLLFSGVVIIAVVYAVYRLRKIKRKKKK